MEKTMTAIGYLSCDRWGHLFGPGPTETATRWVLDCESGRLAFAEHQRLGQWRKLSRDAAADLLESIQHNDFESDLDGFDVSCVNALPGWARASKLHDLYVMWDRLGVAPCDDDGRLEEGFAHFAPGTHREDVWRWFEAQDLLFVVGDVMQGIRLDEAALCASVDQAKPQAGSKVATIEVLEAEVARLRVVPADETPGDANGESAQQPRERG